jgi:hypothetical protein
MIPFCQPTARLLILTSQIQSVETIYAIGLLYNSNPQISCQPTTNRPILNSLDLVQFTYCNRPALFYRSHNSTRQLHKTPNVDYNIFWNTFIYIFCFNISEECFTVQYFHWSMYFFNRRPDPDEL